MKYIYFTLCWAFTSLFVFGCAGKEIKLSVMSYNIRYDNPEDSLNGWAYRKDVAARVIVDHNIDVLGTQEVLYNQMEDLKARLTGYETIGVGREDGKTKGEYSAIFYKADRFNVVKSGWFWLSETPDIPGSKGWDAACERIATWAILNDKPTEKSFFFINTHLDHLGKVAREKGVSLLVEQIEKLSEGLPVIMTGDFNADRNSDVIRHILDGRNAVQMFDSNSFTASGNAAKGTFHDFGKIPEDKRLVIDYIFVSRRVKSDEYQCLDEKLNGVYLSDHSPIMAKLTVR